MGTRTGSSSERQARWNEVIFDAPLKNEDRLHAVLLYSDAGLRATPFMPGERLTLDLPDVQFRGPATVVKIQPSAETARVEGYVLRVVQFRNDDDLGKPLHGNWQPPPEAIARWRSRRREIVLKLDQPDGGWCDIELLRTVDWITEVGARVGGKVFLDLSEVGTRGWAEVLEIRPCGVPDIGPGEMLTGTFRHSHGQIGELVVESESEPIGVTPGHLIWSVDRQDWVPVGELCPGEALQTEKGITKVVSYTLTEIVEPVYNLEVAHDHCYRIGETGILVHNMSAMPPADLTKEAQAAIEEKGCCLSDSLAVFVADYPWPNQKFSNEMMGVVYVIWNSKDKKVMKVGKTGSKKTTWVKNWWRYTDAEELCGLPEKTLVMYAWAFPWDVKDGKKCVPAVENVESSLRTKLCRDAKMDCQWDNVFTGQSGPGVPGEPTDGKGRWDGCKWKPGETDPGDPYHKGLSKAKVEEALQKTSWNVAAAAKLLNVSR